jgi:hypothetical protein
MSQEIPGWLQVGRPIETQIKQVLLLRRSMGSQIKQEYRIAS